MADINELETRTDNLVVLKDQMATKVQGMENPRSDYFQVDYRFLGAESLLGEEKRRYQMWQEHVRELYEIIAEPLTRGGKFKTNEKGSYVRDAQGRMIFEPTPHGALNVYQLRNFGFIADQLLIDLIVYGSKEAFDFLRDMSLSIAKWTVTEYSWPVSADAAAMAIPGVQKYINWSDNEGTGFSGFSRPLDNNLSFGTFACVNLAFKSNPERIKVRDQKAFENLTLGLLKQMLYASIVKYGTQEQKNLWGRREYDPDTGKVTKLARCDTLSLFEIMDIYNAAGCPMDLERWGHSLLHPTQAMYTAMHALFLTYKRKEFAQARDRIGKKLKDVRLFVDSPRGEMLVQPHMIPSQAKYVSGTVMPDSDMRTQDITYCRESQPKHMIALLTGAPHVSWREAGAFVRTFMWCGLYNGPTGPRIAGSIGGLPKDPAKFGKIFGKKVLVLEGEKTIPSKMPLGNQGEPEYINSATRGMNAIGLCAAQDEDLVRRVKIMNDGPDPKKIRAAETRGNDMCILLYEHFKGKNLVS